MIHTYDWTYTIVPEDGDTATIHKGILWAKNLRQAKYMVSKLTQTGEWRNHWKARKWLTDENGMSFRMYGENKVTIKKQETPHVKNK